MKIATPSTLTVLFFPLTALLTITHNTTTPSSSSLRARSRPGSLLHCTGPWPPLAPPNLFRDPLVRANIDIAHFPTLQSFCTAPVPANCECAFDARTARWKVRCDDAAAPLAHIWGYMYAMRYCEMWCSCANLQALPMGMRGVMRGGDEGDSDSDGGGVR
ncbi:hypothetical protein MMC16_001549 [Acarospora aff. strigata]|nr:hypothetical protein [Acarospora aff. strigata]